MMISTVCIFVSVNTSFIEWYNKIHVVTARRFPTPRQVIGNILQRVAGPLNFDFGSKAEIVTSGWPPRTPIDAGLEHSIPRVLWLLTPRQFLRIQM
jgi:hypothetical protein